MSHLVKITKERRTLQKNLMPKYSTETILKSVDEIMFSTAVADSQKIVRKMNNFQSIN